jgi:S-adenosylmethionine-dependent methyltransferase
MMSKVEDFYDGSPQREWERLERHRTEFAVTRRALKDYLPKSPATILDIGGGPGRYAIELTQDGYRVTLLDISNNNLILAGQKAAEAGVTLAGLLHGNAVDLDQIQDQRFDAVLLMGPLYHLTHLDERVKALHEAWRVLKPGGIIFAAFISRYATFRDGSVKYPEEIYKERTDWEKLWVDGVNFGGGFTDAYFAMPDEICPLLEGAGFTTRALLGVEGIVAEHEDTLNRLSGPAWDYWVEKNYSFARDPALLAAADHLLYIGFR